MNQLMVRSAIMLSLLLVGGQLTYAQRYDIPTLYFKNGDTVQGERHAFLGDQVQFSKTLKAKPVKYDFDEIIKVDVIDKRKGTRTTYVREAVVGKRKKVTLELVEEGFLSCYRLKIYSALDASFSYALYLKRKDETAMTFIRDQNPLGLGFRKSITRYLKDCPAVVGKIDAKEFKRRHMDKIVRYYNENCVEK